MSVAFVNVLEVTAIIVAGTMTGNEIAVAVFFHPQINRLPDAVHAPVARSLARALGAAMPFWYALTFLLTVAVAFVARSSWTTPRWLGLSSATLIACMIIYSVLLAVPINNQVARWQPDSLPKNWRELRARWDFLHQVRVVVLIAALILLVWSCVGAAA